MTSTSTKEAPFNVEQPQLTEAAKHRNSAASSKDEYRAFCQQEASLHMFARDWWLDATAGADGWDVALVKKNGQVVATMPYVLRRRYGLMILSQPALTHALGPWLRPHPGQLAAQLGNEKELMHALIEQLPRFDHFTQTWQPTLRNWQPFYWKGFGQTTYYTYVLPDLSDTAKVLAGFEHATRRNIKKATGEHQLQVRDDLPVDDLLELSRKTFARQGLAPPYSDDYVRRLDAACAERGCRKLFIAVDPSGVQHAGCYVVWDGSSMYGLFGGADPALRSSSAHMLCYWAAIQHAATVTRQFNFAGSMIESVERTFRGFGGSHVPYFHITKTNSRLLKVRETLLSLTGRR